MREGERKYIGEKLKTVTDNINSQVRVVYLFPVPCHKLNALSMASLSDILVQSVQCGLFDLEDL